MVWNRTEDEQFDQMIEENFDLFARRRKALGSWDKVARELLDRFDQGILKEEAAKLAPGTEGFVDRFVEKISAIAIERKKGARVKFRN